MQSSLPEILPDDFMTALAHLESKDALGVDEMKLMILLETAGDPLYQKLASLAPNEEAADLLLRNAREETAHAHRLKHAIEILTGTPFEIPALSENPYASPPPFTDLTPQLLAGLIAGEKNGDAGYQKWADNESNPEVAELLRRNGHEETQHSERVARVAEILSR